MCQTLLSAHGIPREQKTKAPALRHWYSDQGRRTINYGNKICSVVISSEKETRKGRDGVLGGKRVAVFGRMVREAHADLESWVTEVSLWFSQLSSHTNYTIFQHRFLHLVLKDLVYGFTKCFHGTNGNTLRFTKRFQCVDSPGLPGNAVGEAGQVFLSGGQLV